MLVHTQSRTSISRTYSGRARAAESPPWIPNKPHLRVVKSTSRNGPIGPDRNDAVQTEATSLHSILCVEDDQETATLLTETLQDRGCAVDIAPDGEIGLAKIFANRPDLVICDMWMRWMSGLEVLQKLTEAGPEYADLPFIFLTGRHDRDGELAGRRLGADDYLTKPVDVELLAVVVENRLRRASGRSAPLCQVHLTKREKEVLTWVGRGKTSAEIAIILALSERTVNFHCDQAMKRLDVINRTQAVVTAITLGVISDSHRVHAGRTSVSARRTRMIEGAPSV